MANLQFVPTQGSTTAATLTLEDIPEEVRNDAEQVYETLKTNVGRMRVQFETIGELKAYESQMKAYCGLRPGGPVRFRKSPTKDLPKTAMDFRITDITAGEAATEEIRDAVEAAKAPRKTPAK